MEANATMIRERDMLWWTLRKLKSSDESKRIAALWKLNDSRKAEIVEPLIEALSDSASEVRKLAARGLGNAGDERAIKPLVPLLQDDDIHVREEAIYSLAQFDNNDVTELLVAALENQLEDVRLKAADILGKRAWQPKSGPEQTTFENVLSERDEIRNRELEKEKLRLAEEQRSRASQLLAEAESKIRIAMLSALGATVLRDSKNRGGSAQEAIRNAREAADKLIEILTKYRHTDCALVAMRLLGETEIFLHPEIREKVREALNKAIVSHS
jgi:regulator of protease activity HflC (stomatin/prohibitin superfamily)